MAETQLCLLLFLSMVTIAVTSPPHIVFIVADDLGWNDVGWHNPEMITPNLDNLARMGIILNSSYVAPVCTPSRASFMTGRYAYHTGLQHIVILPEAAAYLGRNYSTLPEELKKLGYCTHMIGKWHLGFCNWKYTPTERGFDSFYGYYNGAEDYYTKDLRIALANGWDFRNNTTAYRNEEYSAVAYARRAEEIIRSHDQTKPLFLYLPFQSVHAPLQVPARFENMYSSIKNEDRRKYCGMVSALDEAIGNVTTALFDTGIADNMVLVFTTDNGGPTYAAANNLPLRGAKTTLWEGGTKGAAFVFSKTLFKRRNYENTQMFHASDWFPTLLRAAGGTPVAGIDGIDQWDVLMTGAPSKRKEFVYNIDEKIGNGAIRVGDMKLIEGSPGRFNGWYPLPKATPPGEEYPELLYNADEQMYLYGRYYTYDANLGKPAYKLFNITADPTEHVDLSSQYPEIVAQLKARLDFYKQSLVPSFSELPRPRANPIFHNGIWSPGWC